MNTYCYALAVTLLSALVYARHDIVIKDADELNRNPLAKLEFCEIVNQCNLTSSVSANVVNELKHTLDVCSKEQNEVEQQNKQLKAVYDSLRKEVDELKQWKKDKKDLEEFDTIADLKPEFWLSAKYYDGFENSRKQNRTGVAPSTDVLNNPVLVKGTVPVNIYNGTLAYKFDKTNSIKSKVTLGNKYTLMLLFNFPARPDELEGRILTATSGNKLLGGYHGCVNYFHATTGVYMNENDCMKTLKRVLVIATNDDGVKNFWVNRRQLVNNANAGAKDWGVVVVGSPDEVTGDAVVANVYEVIGFNRVLPASQREDVMSVIKKWYDDVEF